MDFVFGLLLGLVVGGSAGVLLFAIVLAGHMPPEDAHSKLWSGTMRTLQMIFIIILASSPGSAQEHTFKSGDYIDITVYNEEALTGEFRILSDGNIRLPMVGKVKAEGLTESQLESNLRTAVGGYINEPFITISARYPVYVMGFVNRPGVFTVEDTRKIIEVIAEAGGFAPEASGSINLYRRDSKLNINKSSILNGNTSLGYIEPGDIVVAKRKMFTRSDYTIILSTLTAISLSVFYLNQ